MGGFKADLENLFNGAVAAFNQPDYARVLTLLVANAVVQSVRQPQQLFQGQRDIANWLDSQDDRPTFKPDNGTAFNLDGPDGVAITATIKGMGMWHDQHGDDHLQFTFRCQFINNRWLFTDLRTSGARPEG